jgi:hypothetical protein
MRETKAETEKEAAKRKEAEDKSLTQEQDI